LGILAGSLNYSHTFYTGIIYVWAGIIEEYVNQDQHKIEKYNNLNYHIIKK
jgi:hypothetical protein